LKPPAPWWIQIPLIFGKVVSAGITVTRLQCVGDDITSFHGSYGNRKKADVALVTGGLGPTTDDLTAQAAATAKGVSLELSHTALESVKAFFASRNREMPRIPQKTGYAFPKGTRKFWKIPVGNRARAFYP